MTCRSPVALSCIALILAATAVCAQFPANPDFADGAVAWTLPDGAAIDGAEGTRGALSLTSGWALSGASAAPLTGWQRVDLRIRATGREADSRLLVALVAQSAQPVAQIAVSASDAGQGWRTLSAEVLPPHGEPASLAIGVTGSGGWLIDSVAVAGMDAPAAAALADPPVLAESLPEGWQPEGLLDAISRPIAGATELLVHVGGLEVTLPPAVSTLRGHRGAIQLIVRNRAMKDRPLTISVAGPPGFYVPERTVNIRTGADTVFKTSLQAFTTGTHHVRMTLRTGDFEASAPIEVEVAPSFPAPGVAFTTGAPPPGAIAALPGMSIPLIASPPTPGLPAQFTRLWLVHPPWSETVLQSVVAEATAETPACADFAALYRPRDAEPAGDAVAMTRALRRTVDAAQAPLFLLGPVADLLTGQPPAIAESDLAAAGTLGGGGNIAAATLRLPVLEARPARAVSLDRTSPTTTQPCWTDFMSALQIDQIPAAIRQSARLPMFFADLAARPTGSDESDALLLARALAVCAWQGATGWTIPAEPEDAPDGADAWTLLDDAGQPRRLVAATYSELSRELAAAVPVAILRQTPEIGSAPTAAVGFRPFLRNDEGILALWNNTGAPVDLIFETHTPPLDVHTLSITAGGVRRGYAGSFTFSQEAIALNRPVVFLTLAPGEFRMLSMQLASPITGWLSSVEFQPKISGGGNRPRSFGEAWDGGNPRR